tara:strand:- start:1992 stop:3302 length:1311 start_codon:yes stop_codon:yes gene_type:complete
LNLILGFGSTGASVARYLVRKNEPFLIMDSRQEPSGLQEISRLNPSELHLGRFDPSILSKVSRVIVSPGISYNNPVLKTARHQGKIVQTDIEIFLKESKSKVVLVTGTNGKTTVISMAEKLLKTIYGKKKVISLGNIGKPVLDALEKDYEISLIEISSFHLELSTFISSSVGVLLNVSQDHLDRHKSLEEYEKVKKKILSNTKLALVGDKKYEVYTKGIIKHLNFNTLFDGHEVLFSEFLSRGWPEHENANLKASIAIYLALELLNKNIDLTDINCLEKIFESSINILKSYKRLPHRYEILGARNGLTFINDSKATNISSTLRALESAVEFYGPHKVLLICGGDSKEQNMAELLNGPVNCLKKVFLFGKDSQLIQEVIYQKVAVEQVSGLEEAIKKCFDESKKGDVCLLSPACASTDMFTSYKERGNLFKTLVGFD